MRLAIASLAVAIVLTCARSSFAAPNVSIEFQVPAAETASGCPDRGDFFAALQKRVPGAALTDTSAAAHAARLRITPSGSGFEGTLELSSQDAEPTSRTVQGPSCAEVGEALALVLALAVEQREVEVQKARSEPPREPIIGEAPIVPPPPRWRVGAVLQGTARAGIGRDIAPGAGAAVELRQSGSGIGFRPSARVGAAGSVADWPVDSRLGSANATMYVLMLGFEACALRASTRTEWLAIDLCVRFEGGFVEGHVKPLARGTNAPWLLAAAVLRLRMELLGPVFAEVEGSLGTPLARNRWRLGDDFESIGVFEQPAVAAGAAVGLGVTFP